MEKKKVIIPDKLKAKRDDLMREMERIADDPKVREEGEKLHRELSHLTAEDLFRVIG